MITRGLNLYLKNSILALLCSGVLVSASNVSAREAVGSDKSVIASLRIQRVEGKSSFGFAWNPQQYKGTFNIALVWNRFSSDVSHGFYLSRATDVAFLSPILPLGCAVKNIDGYLNWREDGMSSLTVAVEGATCSQFFADIRLNPMTIEIRDVPHIVNSEITSELILDIDDVP